MVVAATRRRSPRLAAAAASENETDAAGGGDDESKLKPRASSKKRKRETSTSKTKKEGSTAKKGAAKVADCLARTREASLRQERPSLSWVMGIDEAGRGPLAGPVVAAAAVVPFDICGITDSKKITCETAREELYEEIVASPEVSWAVAVVDAARIDEINILQASLQAMSMAASALVLDSEEAAAQWHETCKAPACASRKGCYVACGGKPLEAALQSPLTLNNNTNQKPGDKESDDGSTSSTSSYFALVDGNRVPADLPCEGESIVKGDSKEYSIAAASILAKVTRDRLMHAYDKLYPEYNLAQHKGYPTREHMSAVFKFGASPIHRRTFAPLKHMEFDKDGKVISS